MFSLSPLMPGLPKYKSKKEKKIFILFFQVFSPSKDAKTNSKSPSFVCILRGEEEKKKRNITPFSNHGTYRGQIPHPILNDLLHSKL
jgi:hypothetical protein